MHPSFYLFRIVAWAIARIPFIGLYILSDGLALALKHVIRYRRGTVRANLKKSFPELRERPLRKISDQYYRNLADTMLEVIKLSRIRPENLTDRFEFTNIQLLHGSLEKKKSVIIAIGHCGNWEWMGTALGLAVKARGFALTKPLADQKFHEYMEKVRHRLNPGSTIPYKSAFRTMVKRKSEPSFYVIAADQTPTFDEATYWTTFLNQDTPFFQGIEKIARSLDFHVIFIDIRRTGRGRYRGDLQLVTDQPEATADGEITEKYIRLLETSIRMAPANWLWSHRRWKHSRDRIHR